MSLECGMKGLNLTKGRGLHRADVSGSRAVTPQAESSLLEHSPCSDHFHLQISPFSSGCLCVEKPVLHVLLQVSVILAVYLGGDCLSSHLIYFLINEHSFGTV